MPPSKSIHNKIVSLFPPNEFSPIVVRRINWYQMTEQIWPRRWAQSFQLLVRDLKIPLQMSVAPFRSRCPLGHLVSSPKSSPPPTKSSFLHADGERYRNDNRIERAQTSIIFFSLAFCSWWKQIGFFFIRHSLSNRIYCFIYWRRGKAVVAIARKYAAIRRLSACYSTNRERCNRSVVDQHNGGAGSGWTVRGNALSQTHYSKVIN